MMTILSERTSNTAQDDDASTVLNIDKWESSKYDRHSMMFTIRTVLRVRITDDTG